jgi:hypothetical protein
VGGFEAGTPVSVEPTLRYHPDCAGVLTLARDPGRGQCQVGSLTGAVASQSVTEALEGGLSTVGNRASSVRAEARLTVRPTSRTGTKVGSSDPVVPSGRAIAQRIKGTPGITG